MFTTFTTFITNFHYFYYFYYQLLPTFTTFISCFYQLLLLLLPAFTNFHYTVKNRVFGEHLYWVLIRMCKFYTLGCSDRVLW